MAGLSRLEWALAQSGERMTSPAPTQMALRKRRCRRLGTALYTLRRMILWGMLAIHGSPIRD